MTTNNERLIELKGVLADRIDRILDSSGPAHALELLWDFLSRVEDVIEAVRDDGFMNDAGLRERAQLILAKRLTFYARRATYTCPEVYSMDELTTDILAELKVAEQELAKPRASLLGNGQEDLEEPDVEEEVRHFVNYPQVTKGTVLVALGDSWSNYDMRAGDLYRVLEDTYIDDPETIIPVERMTRRGALAGADGVYGDTGGTGCFARRFAMTYRTYIDPDHGPDVGTLVALDESQAAAVKTLEAFLPHGNIPKVGEVYEVYCYSADLSRVAFTGCDGYWPVVDIYYFDRGVPLVETKVFA